MIEPAGARTLVRIDVKLRPATGSLERLIGLLARRRFEVRRLEFEPWIARLLVNLTAREQMRFEGLLAREVGIESVHVDAAVPLLR